jgi:hypothetical protein
LWPLGRVIPRLSGHNARTTELYGVSIAGTEPKVTGTVMEVVLRTTVT